MILGNNPVFIGGSGRSGTSYLFRVISQQDGFISFGSLESKFIIEGDGLLDLYRALVSDYNASRSLFALRRFSSLMLDSLAQTASLGQGSLTEVIDADAYQRIVQEYLNVLVIDNVPRYLTSPEFCTLAFDFVERLLLEIAKGDTTRRFVEKTPHNILHIWFLRRLFPQARILQIVRDPRAVVLSLLRQDWGPSTLEGCSYWLREVYKAFDAQHDSWNDDPSNGVKTIRLEDFVNQFDVVTADIATYLDIPTLQISPDSVDKNVVVSWEENVSSQDVAIIEGILAPFIKRYGYSIMS